MQDEGSDGIHQGAAKIDIASLENVVALAFTLVTAGVVAPADQTGTAKDLAGVGIVGRVADGSSQAGYLDNAQTFEFHADLIRRVCDEFGQALFEQSDVSLDSFKQPIQG